MENATCFVIQPFDKGKFDKRFNDVFKPAIEDAGLDAYRIDMDPSVSIPIVEIENGIREARVCLAEITLDNPNVWFELGFAIASQKPVVLVCSNERSTKFPFDVQHRSIIKYSTESSSDFVEFQTNITERIKALLHKEESLMEISTKKMINIEIEGLSSHEIIVIAAIAENLYTPDSNVIVEHLRRDVEKSGFTKVACTFGIKTLLQKGLILHDSVNDEDGNYYTVYSLTDQGWDWVLNNQDKFQIKKPPSSEIPF